MNFLCLRQEHITSFCKWSTLANKHCYHWPFDLRLSWVLSPDPPHNYYCRHAPCKYEQPSPPFSLTLSSLLSPPPPSFTPHPFPGNWSFWDTSWRWSWDLSSSLTAQLPCAGVWGGWDGGVGADNHRQVQTTSELYCIAEPMPVHLMLIL